MRLLEVEEIALAALYLRGLARPLEVRRSAWQAVDSAIRAAAPNAAGASHVLRRAGFVAEALVLEAPGALDEARAELGAGRVLTAGSGPYPTRWLRTLGPAAPPALWVRGAVPGGPYIAIVGSRVVDARTRCFARETAMEAVARGFAVVSGGAAGCDRAAASGAGKSLLELAPCGFRHRRVGAGGELTVCAPDEPFSSATAMERNTLVVAASELVVVAHARFKEGGTWHAATEALRRRLAPVAVRWSEDDPAARALVGLGALPMATACDLADTLAEASKGGGMF